MVLGGSLLTEHLLIPITSRISVTIRDITYIVYNNCLVMVNMNKIVVFLNIESYNNCYLIKCNILVLLIFE